MQHLTRPSRLISITQLNNKIMKTTYEITSYRTTADFKKGKSDCVESGYTKKFATHCANVWLDTNQSAVVVIKSSDKKYSETLVKK